MRHLLKALGPGILFASTCIGVSHLVQSTRAGADYGYAFLWAIIVANIFKYPFFEFASRYTAATGISIIDGYKKKSPIILWVYFIITIPSMFIVTAAVTFVTAGLLGNLFPGMLTTDIWSLIIFVVCLLVLLLGKYHLIDNLLKVVGLILVISTVITFISSLIYGRPPVAIDFEPKDAWSSSGIIFLIALMGWMPTAVDIATWPSLWSEAKTKDTGYKPTLKESSFDFNFGYWTSAILAIMFLTLGATLIYGSGTELSNSSPVFAGQLISMFTEAMGDWSYYVIAIAAFSTMFSTTITVIDGYGRAMARTTTLLRNKKETRSDYSLLSVLACLGALLIISRFLNDLKQLVDIATILSFVIAPLAAFLNYKVIFSEEVPESYRPKAWLKNLAVAGMIFLAVFILIYFYVLANA